MDYNTQRAYLLMIEDYLKICEFVEPSELNKNVYSHRIYELFLRVCTEFESVCRMLLIKYSYPKAGSTGEGLTVNDYNKLMTDNQMLGQRLSEEVGLLFWKGGVKFIKPFGDWENGIPLSWYRAYNDSKHSRDKHFDKASFDNLTFSLAGLFLLHQKNSSWSFFQPYTISKMSGSAPGGGYTCQGSIFSVKGPYAGA